MIKQIDGFLHIFDKFGEPVAELNMGGITRYKTRLGGVCGLAIYCLLTWFIVIRCKQMTNRSNPTLSEVTQGINLMADDSPVFNFASNNFYLGVNIIGTKVLMVGDPKTGELQILPEFVDLDLSEIMDLKIIQKNSSKAGLHESEKEKTICEQEPGDELAFLKNGATCSNSSLL